LKDMIRVVGFEMTRSASKLAYEAGGIGPKTSML